jgi:hypothetical protein
MGEILMGRTTVCAAALLLAGCAGRSSDDVATVTDSTTDAGDETAATDPGESGESGESTGQPEGMPGCADAWFRELPTDTGVAGPWPVGARTVTLDGLTVEVWYPAIPGSETDIAPKVYDIREQLPASEADKIPDAENPAQPCACHEELPIDDAYGPYPVIVFVHGTAGFRTQSLHHMVHWASRGFVVLAADHPGLKLGDLLGSICGETAPPQTLSDDVATQLAAARGDVPGLEWLSPHLDMDRIGLSGHSAGGRAVGGLSDIGHVIVPMAAGGVDSGSALESVLVLGGTADSVVAYAQQQDGYASSPAPKRLVGLEGAGHLAFSDICSLENDDGDDLITIATNNEVCGAQFATVLFQCGDDLLPDPDGWAISRRASAAAFEETLQCRDIGPAFTELAADLPGVAEVLEDI